MADINRDLERYPVYITHAPNYGAEDDIAVKGETCTGKNDTLRLPKLYR
ncbi:MAG: hypothetical protein SCALA701_04080 [Candidatus Scalindua sp.]|nr:MAG: hypothetical protein SCALA701_04080 [Candidatus Scalindua sp.]